MYFTFLLHDIILLHAVFLSVFSVHPPLVADLCAQRLLCPTWLTLSHHWWISSYTCLRIGGLGFISSTLPWRQWLAELCCCFFLLCIGLICRILLVCQGELQQNNPCRNTFTCRLPLCPTLCVYPCALLQLIEPYSQLMCNLQTVNLK